MTALERLLALSRRTRRQIIYRFIRRRTGSVGITNDGHGRGVIFFPDDVDKVRHLAGDDMWEALADLAEDRLEVDDRVPAFLYNLIVDDHIDYLEHSTPSGSTT